MILAIPSNGLHSNGFSLIRKILEDSKITKFLKKELLLPTKIYTKEILPLVKNNLIHSAANITGGGLTGNIIRSIPKDLTVNLNLSKIKTLKIFKWLKSKNISDNEMLKTFNCGVGFCVIAKKNKIDKIKKYFNKKYQPYEIGFISKSKVRLNLSGKIKW